jgi:hypothetical protein
MPDQNGIPEPIVSADNGRERIKWAELRAFQAKSIERKEYFERLAEKYALNAKRVKACDHT